MTASRRLGGRLLVWLRLSRTMGFIMVGHRCRQYHALVPVVCRPDGLPSAVKSLVEFTLDQDERRYEVMESSLRSLEPPRRHVKVFQTAGWVSSKPAVD